LLASTHDTRHEALYRRRQPEYAFVWLVWGSQEISFLEDPGCIAQGFLRFWFETVTETRFGSKL
jgi:hypothetical protein